MNTAIDARHRRLNPSLFPLEEMVQESVDFLREHEPPEGYFVGFSGGKDSIVTLELCRLAGVKHQAFYSSTGIDSWDDFEFFECGMSPLSAIPVKFRKPRHCFYRADGRNNDFSGWKPSIHMPRWASRITLEIINIRAEQLQEISEKDAKAEGIQSCVVPAAPPLHSETRFIAPGVRMTNVYGEVDYNAPAHSSAKAAYACLWASLNAKRGYGWDVNPLVWVIDFRRVEK